MVEGSKTIRELIDSRHKVNQIFTTVEAQGNFVEFPENIVTLVTKAELQRASLLKNPKDALALCTLEAPAELKSVPVTLVLDSLQDPGNLGTLIRLADWFGIEQIVCSPDTVDLYSPKVIQASMGSFTRVHVVYTDLMEFLKNSPHPTIGTDMEGEDLYKFDFPDHYNIVLGNEGNGMSKEVRACLDTTITIPRFGKAQKTESLNVSMAAGIILGVSHRK